MNIYKIFCLFVLTVCSALAQSYDDALNLYNNRNYEASISVLNSLNIKPSNINEYLLLIDNYIKLQNYTMAQTLIDDAYRYHSKDYRVLERKLTIELLNNKNNEARTTINQIKALDSKNYLANYAEGVLSERVGYYKTAMSLYERAMIINRTRSEATVALAYLKLANGDRNAALDLFNLNVKNNPRMAESYYNLANYYYITGNYNASLNEIKNALYYYTNYNDAKILQANVYMALDRYNDAIAILEYLPESSFRDDTKNYYIGNVYEKANNFPSAKNAYINYLRVKPEDELGRLAYERVLFNTNPQADYERDRAALYYANKSSYYTRLADKVRSQAYLKHMLKLNPANTYARLMLSDVYKRMGLEEKALEELEIAKNVNPTNKSIVYKYDSYKRKLDKNIISRTWGIDNQYNVERPGFTVAIADTINIQKDSPMFLNTALYQTLSYVLPQYGRFNVVDIYNTYYSERDLYQELKRRNADYYLRGSTFSGYDNITLMLDLVDVNTERVVTNFTITTRGRDKMMTVAVMAGNVINNTVPFYSKIIKIHNDNIYINAGKLQGLSNNMNMMIYNTTKAELNMTNAESIGMAKVITVDENVSLIKLIDNRALSKLNINQITVPYVTNTVNTNIAAVN